MKSYGQVAFEQHWRSYVGIEEQDVIERLWEIGPEGHKQAWEDVSQAVIEAFKQRIDGDVLPGIPAEGWKPYAND